MECKERVLFDLIESMDVDCVDGMDIVQHEWLYPDFSYRVYHVEGYCFDVKKEHQCNPDEVEDFNIYQLQEDGCTYEYSSNWDGFKELILEDAIELMKKYGVFI